MELIDFRGSIPYSATVTTRPVSGGAASTFSFKKIIMIDDIRNWIGDIASGAINEKRIALSQEEAAAFKRQLDESISDLAVLRAENGDLMEALAKLESENNALKAKLYELSQTAEPDDRLSEECEKVLKFFFDQDRKLSIEEVRSAFGYESGVAKYYFDQLKSRDFIYYRTRVITSRNQHEPARYTLLSGGREYVMKFLMDA